MLRRLREQVPDVGACTRMRRHRRVAESWMRRPDARCATGGPASSRRHDVARQ
jgi:hypothetical protein